MYLQFCTRDKLKLRSKDGYDLKNKESEINNGGRKNLKNKGQRLEGQKVRSEQLRQQESEGQRLQ